MKLLRAVLAMLAVLGVLAVGLAVFFAGLLGVLLVTLLLRLVFTPLAAAVGLAGVLWWSWQCKLFLDRLGEEVTK